MQLSTRSELKGRNVPVVFPPHAWGRAAIVLGITFLYVAFFRWLLERAGPVASALITVPVAAAGWYFGFKGGLISSFLGILLNTTLLARFAGGDWLTWLAFGWPENLMLIAMGYVTSVLHERVAERMHFEEESRIRERFLVLMDILTKDVLDPKDADSTYYYLITHLVNLFVGDYAYLTYWDAGQEQAVFLASTLLLEQPHSGRVVLGAEEAAVTASVLQSGRVLAIEDVSKSRHLIHPAPHGELSLPLRSALVIPLAAGRYRFGAATITYGTRRRFTREEIGYAELAGNQIALALWAREQGLRLQQRLKEAGALANIARVLSETERVGLETVLQLIVDSAKILIPGAERVVLHLLDDDRQTLVPRAIAGLADEARTDLKMRLGEGVAGMAIASRQVVVIPDVQADERFIHRAPAMHLRSLLVAPIQSHDRLVGTISVQSNQVNAFSKDDGRLLAALSTQAAIAIENANLLERTRQDLKEINALYHISRGLVASLDADELMEDVVKLLQQDFGYYHVQVYVKDPENGGFLARHGSGEIGARLREQGYRLPVGAGIVGHVAEIGRPFVTNDVEQVVFFVRNPLLPDTQAELAVPIQVDGNVLGVLDIQQASPGRLTSRDLQLMISVADQLAAALQKARLYNDLQASLQQEQAMRSRLIQSERLAVAGRLLASVSHELNNPLQAIHNALFLVMEDEKLSADGRQYLEIVLSETERMTTLLNRLRSIYRPAQTEDFQEIQLNRIVEDVCTLTATHMRHKQIAFEFIADPALPKVFAAPDQMRQVVLNLFMNAIEAMQTGGHLTAATRYLSEQGRVLFSVTDSGPGIDPEILPHIFEPFVTGKTTGMGLGLAIVEEIVRQHGGDIQAENNPSGGATFRVYLPVKGKGGREERGKGSREKKE